MTHDPLERIADAAVAVEVLLAQDALDRDAIIAVLDGLIRHLDGAR